MKHRIRIDEHVPGQPRWVWYNDRQEHQIEPAFLEKTLHEAGTYLWSKDGVHGRKLGRMLFDLLNGTGGLVHRLLQEQEDLGEITPIYLQIPRNLSDLPFEIICDDNQFVTVKRNFPIIRQVSERNRRNVKDPERRPIKLLFMACSPKGSGSVLAYEAEEEVIVQVLEEEKLPVDLQFEDSGSLNGLKFALRNFDPTDIVHLSGHAGMFEQKPVFAMETDTGFQKLANPTELWRAMENHPPKLLFLSGCKTGMAEGSASHSFAREMVIRGIPWVIGWGLPVGDQGATRFAKSFYNLLAEGFAPELAVTRARRDTADDYETWSQLRAFCDGTPSRPLTDPKERVVHRTPRKTRYQFLQQSQIKVLEYGFVGRRRQVQSGIQVLRGELADKNGLLLTGPAGVGKSSLTGKIVERFPEHELVVFSGEISEIEIMQRLEGLFDKKRNPTASGILGTGATYESRIKDLFNGPFQEMPTLLIFDDFENGNLEPQGLGHRLRRGKAAVLQPLLEALPWAGGKTQLIISSRYPFKLETKSTNWIIKSLELISLMSLRGVDLLKKKRFLTHLAASPYHQVYENLSGGNPRLMEWFESLAAQTTIPDLDHLKDALHRQNETFIHQYLADLLVAAQEPQFATFLAKASVYQIPVPAEAISPFGQPELLDRAVGLTLMEKEGQHEPVFWVMPLIRDRQWGKVPDPEAIHRVAYSWLDKRAKETKGFNYALVDACLHHGARGFAMRGCWHHAIAMSHFFLNKTLVREGVARLKPLMQFLPEGGEAEVETNAVVFINNLAQLLQSTDRLSEAEPLMKRALAIDEASFGPDHPNVAIRLNNLAALFQATNRLPEAEPLRRRALAIDEAAFGPNHPNVAIRLNNLARLLQITNRHLEAELLMKRALTIDEAAFGPNHRNVVKNLNNLAQLLQETNRLSKAEPLMKRALAIDEASFGPDHPNVARDLNNLAVLFQATNRLSEAEPLIKRALAIDKAFFGPDHSNVAIRLNNLAQLFQATNRLPEAEPLMKRALAIDEAIFGPKHPDVANRLNNLARLLQDTNRHSEAEPLMKRALTIDLAAFGPNHPKVAVHLNNLAVLLQDTNQLSKAEPLVKRALAIDEASFGPDHPTVAIRLNNLAALFQATDRLPEAEPLMKRALAIDEAALGPNHPSVANRLNNLARLFQETNRLSEAEPLMKRALAIMIVSFGERHPHARIVAGNYNSLLKELKPRN